MDTIKSLTEEAVELTALAAGLNDRTVDWREWNDELTCDEKQEVAAEEAAEAARQAWERLEAAERAAYREAMAKLEETWPAVRVAENTDRGAAA